MFGFGGDALRAFCFRFGEIPCVIFALILTGDDGRTVGAVSAGDSAFVGLEGAA